MAVLRYKSGLIQFYGIDTVEFLEDYYLKDHTKMFRKGYIPSFYFEFDTAISTINIDLYKVNEDKLRSGTLETIKETDLTSLSSSLTVYRAESVYGGVGLYRFEGLVNSVNVYSEIFCIKS